MAFKYIAYINVVIFLVPFLLGLFSSTNVFEAVLLLGSLKSFRSEAFEFYQFLSAPFLHANLLHLFVNMYALIYSIGPAVNGIFGNRRFLILYSLSALGGSVLSATFMTNPFGSVGASGAIMGLVGALGAFAMKTDQKSLFWQIITMVLLNFYLGFSIPNIDNFGHLGGLIVGFVYGYFFLTPPKKQIYRPGFTRTIDIDSNQVTINTDAY